VTTLWLELGRFRDGGGGLEVAEGDAGDKGRYEESEAFEAVDEASAVLARALPMAAGGRENCVVSKGPACALVLPVMSVEGAGVGGKLGRGMMGRPAGALIGDGQGQGQVRGRGRGRGRGHRQERSVQSAVPGGDPDTATLETLRRAALSTVSRAVNGTLGMRSRRPISRLYLSTRHAVLLVLARTRRAPPGSPERWVHHSRHTRPRASPEHVCLSASSELLARRATLGQAHACHVSCPTPATMVARLSTCLDSVAVSGHIFTWRGVERTSNADRHELQLYFV
jgi:hypothetical protein